MHTENADITLVNDHRITRAIISYTLFVFKTIRCFNRYRKIYKTYFIAQSIDMHFEKLSEFVFKNVYSRSFF